MKVYVVMIGGNGDASIHDICLTPEAVEKSKKDIGGYAYFMGKEVWVEEYEAKE